MIKDITQATGEGQLADGTWVPHVLTAIGAVAELEARREGSRPPWVERALGCAECRWQRELGQCRLCRAWVCEWHRTLGYQPRQQERRGGVDCQCGDWESCLVRSAH